MAFAALLFAMLAPCPAQAVPRQTPTGPVPHRASGADVLQLELDNNLYFAMPLTLAHAGDLRPEQAKCFQGELDFHEGRFEDARKLLIGAVMTGPTVLTSEQKIEALDTLGRDAELTGEYGGCAQMYADIVQIWGARLGDLEQDMAEHRHFCAVQQHSPRQTVTFTEAFTLHRRGEAYPIQAGTVADAAILDTDAAETTIPESTARAWGVTPGASTTVMHGYGGGAFTGRAGMVPELRIGTATLHNVAVLIVPDATFPAWPGMGRPHALLGLPVLFALGRLSIAQDGTLTVSPTSPDSAATAGSPLWIGDTGLLAQLRTLDATGRSFHYAAGDELRLFALDTGSRDSYLTDHYLNEHRETFKGPPPAKAMLAGGGGEVNIPAYAAEVLPLWCGSSVVYLNGQHVLAVPYPGSVESYEGLIGQDVLGDMQNYTIDLRVMRFSFVPFALPRR